MNEALCYNYSADKDSRVQWPFGYGLTYTTFEYKNLQVTGEAQASDDSVELTFQIKNTGSTAATEIGIAPSRYVLSSYRVSRESP